MRLVVERDNNALCIYIILKNNEISTYIMKFIIYTSLRRIVYKMYTEEFSLDVLSFLSYKTLFRELNDYIVKLFIEFIKNIVREYELVKNLSLKDALKLIFNIVDTVYEKYREMFFASELLKF